MRNHINARNVFCLGVKDPVYSFLRTQTAINPFLFGLSHLLGIALLSTLVAFISQSMWIDGSDIGLFEDWIVWSLIILVIPVISGYYLWSYESIVELFEHLKKTDIIEIPGDQFRVILSSAYSSKWRILFVLSVTFFSTSIFYASRSDILSWTSSGNLIKICSTICTAWCFYLGTMLIANLISNALVLNKVFRNKKLSINPLHPDRAGGLHKLGYYSVKTAYLIGSMGILLGLVEYQFAAEGLSSVYWGIHIFIPAYIILSLLCFFFPLLAAHKGMEAARESLLDNISIQFREDYLKIHSDLTGTADQIENGSKKIKALQEFYKLTEGFPVWPFDTKTLSRYLLTVPSPFIPVLFVALESVLLDWISKLDLL